MINRFSRHASMRIDEPPEVISQHRTAQRERGKRQALLVDRAHGGPNAIVQLLSELSLSRFLRRWRRGYNAIYWDVLIVANVPHWTGTAITRGWHVLCRAFPICS